MMRTDLLIQKLARHVAPRMRRDGVTAWVILTREGAPDPLAAHFGGGTAVGRMALVIRPGSAGGGGAGSASPGAVVLDAVCASYDVAPLEESGLYRRVLTYGREGWSVKLREVMAGGGEGPVAVDVSADEPIGDGLSHTLRGELLDAIGGDGTRLRSSQPLVTELLGRKTDWEIGRIRAAAIEAEGILRQALSAAHVAPDRTTEAELAAWIAEEVERRGLRPAWEARFCPSVQFRTSRGHAAPGRRTVSAGELIAVDFGVEVDGYVSDLQRSAVVTANGRVPEDLQALWEITLRSVDAAASVMRPGATGLAVDTAARSIVHEAGCPDYVHATGHPLGHDVHDVGPMLGPDWPGRYGRRIHDELLPGMVFTLEPAAARETADGLVRIGLEEDVVVTDGGAEFLAPRQTALWTLP